MQKNVETSAAGSPASLFGQVDPFKIVVKIKIKEESEVASLLVQIKEVGERCKRQPGCLSWELVESDVPNILYLVESWTSSDSCQAFQKIEENKTFFNETMPSQTEREVRIGEAIVDLTNPRTSFGM
ncbi:MAG: antibiotic biosynthesis monooxygenase [Gammaproteobacteria bacterium]|nr:antibiotic biosynthesis monooxygenase [Gammaproteobacteria bacterium]